MAGTVTSRRITCCATPAGPEHQPSLHPESRPAAAQCPRPACSPLLPRNPAGAAIFEVYALPYQLRMVTAGARARPARPATVGDPPITWALDRSAG